MVETRSLTQETPDRLVSIMRQVFRISPTPSRQWTSTVSRELVGTIGSSDKSKDKNKCNKYEDGHKDKYKWIPDQGRSTKDPCTWEKKVIDLVSWIDVGCGVADGQKKKIFFRRCTQSNFVRFLRSLRHPTLEALCAGIVLYIIITVFSSSRSFSSSYPSLPAEVTDHIIFTPPPT